MVMCLCRVGKVLVYLFKDVLSSFSVRESWGYVWGRKGIRR